MSDFILDDLTDEEVERQAELYEPLAQRIRELTDACIRSEVYDEETLLWAQEQVAEVTQRLRAKQLDGSFGIRYVPGGRTRAWGNAVIGLRNPVAPPLKFTQHPSGRAECDFHLGAAYEGPPGLVHGGVSSMILDQALGEAASAGKSPGMTGTLTVRYRRGTPLGQLRAEAWIESSEGIKTICRGTIADAQGVCVEAEGIFILPRWARKDVQADLGLTEDAEQPPTRFE